MYDEALPAVYGYFVRRCPDQPTAENLTSETFLAAMDAARRGDASDVTLTWLIGIARHTLAEHFRRHHRFTTPAPDSPDAPDTMDTWDAGLDRIVAEHTLARLTGPHRAVLTLRYLDDCPVDKCAELIGRTVHATEALLVRARQAFHQEYSKGGAL